MVFCGGLGGYFNFEAKRLQDEPNTAVDGNKMSPRRRQNCLRWLQVAPETCPCASKNVFYNRNLENDESQTNFKVFWDGLGGLSDARNAPKMLPDTPRRATIAPRRLQDGPRCYQVAVKTHPQGCWAFINTEIRKC